MLSLVALAAAYAIALQMQNDLIRREPDTKSYMIGFTLGIWTVLNGLLLIMQGVMAAGGHIASLLTYILMGGVAMALGWMVTKRLKLGWILWAAYIGFFGLIGLFAEGAAIYTAVLRVGLVAVGIAYAVRRWGDMLTIAEFKERRAEGL